MPQENALILSVAKAFRLLDILTEAKSALSLAELSERSGCPKSTVYGLLSTMRESSVVEQQSDGRYFLGVRLFEYGCAVSGCWSVSELSRPYLQHLSTKTGESVFLSVLNRNEAITIDQVQSRAGLRVVSEVGTRLPLHCTSQGKMFLASMSGAEAMRIFKSRPIPAYTPQTLVSWAKMEYELAAIRQQNYAVEDGEYKIGLQSVSAPIRDISGQVKYAVGIVGMFHSVQSQEFKNAILLTQSTAAQISTALGYREANK
ncbi:MAG: IclR family transcriptional regulator [Oscillospiraceae bacterium]|nr:IclR family transcriptional regulator [Oscillospiraceae bacterium]